MWCSLFWQTRTDVSEKAAVPIFVVDRQVVCRLDIRGDGKGLGKAKVRVKRKKMGHLTLYSQVVTASSTRFIFQKNYVLFKDFIYVSGIGLRQKSNYLHVKL